MKFLVDVNLSKKKKFLEDHKNLENVRDKIDGRVSDSVLIRYAKEHDYGIYTQDKECALYGLIAGIPVWYKDQKTKQSVKLKAQQLRFTKKEKEEGL
jgi:rRNA-processing protein FCF1